MNFPMFTPCTAESSTSWRIGSGTGESCRWSSAATKANQTASVHKHSGARRPLTLTLPPLRREESQRIADIFLSRRAEFLAFTTYIGHYDRSMSLLEDSCRTSPAFAAIVHQFEVSWNDCGKNVPKLNSLELETLRVC